MSVVQGSVVVFLLVSVLSLIVASLFPSQVMGAIKIFLKRQSKTVVALLALLFLCVDCPSF